MSNKEKNHDYDDQKQLLSRMTINDNKAGMQGLDKEKINKVIMENTIGSRYYKNEQKRDAQVQERILKMKNRLLQYSEHEKNMALQKAHMMIKDIEKERNLSRTIIHIDMDAFFASVEERDQPHLKSKPMAVGGMSMLSTSNYVARKYGVRAAMPGFIAMKLCPQLTIVPVNFTKYKEVSNEIQSIYGEYDDNFMAASLDEAYLDITDHLQSRLLMCESQRSYKYNPELMKSDDKDENKLRTFGFSAEEVAEEIRFRICQKTKLTASAGIGPNLMLAKIGSDLNKPNGQALILFEKDAIMDFMKDLPLRKVSGIGKVSEQLLSALGIQKCGDLLEQRANIVLLFSAASSAFFLRAGLGCSSDRVFQDGERKSISTERTFMAISDEKELFSKLEELCHALSVDMKKSEIQGRTVTLKTKTVSFELHTRSKTSVRALSTASDIFDVAKDLLRHEIDQSSNTLSLRLMGIGMSKLENSSNHKQKTINGFFTKPSNSEAKEQHSPSVEQTCTGDHINSDIETSNFCKENGANFEHEIPSTSTISDNNQQVAINEESRAPNNKDLVCPVCLLAFTELSNLNQHLDQCAISDVKKRNLDETASTDTINECTCPICSVVFECTTLQRFNSHVDSCLNRQTIKDILKSDASSNTVRKSALNSPPRSNKRRKITPKQTNTIEKFFS